MNGIQGVKDLLISDDSSYLSGYSREGNKTIKMCLYVGENRGQVV